MRVVSTTMSFLARFIQTRALTVLAEQGSTTGWSVAGVRLQNRHAHGDAVGNLVEYHRLWAVSNR